MSFNHNENPTWRLALDSADAPFVVDVTPEERAALIAEALAFASDNNAAAPAGFSYRLDRRVELRAPRPNGRGGLYVDAFIARPGILVYRERDPMTGAVVDVRELVPRSVLHDPASLDTYKLMPVTVEHPPGGFVTKDNYSQLSVGTTGERVEIDDVGRPRFTLSIEAARGVEVIQTLDPARQKREISVGSIIRSEKRSGVHPEFGAFDRVQTLRVGNHAALTHTGRAGSDVRLRMDSAIEVREDDDHRGEEPDMLTPEQIKALQDEVVALRSAAATAADADARAAIVVRLDSVSAQIEEAAKASAPAPTEAEIAATAAEVETANVADRQWRRRLDSIRPEGLKADDADKLSTADLNARLVADLKLPVEDMLRLDSADAPSAHRMALAMRLTQKPANANGPLDLGKGLGLIERLTLDSKPDESKPLSFNAKEAYTTN